ncbi:NUDIX hydrolase [Thermodesulfobacteriota bacterium]
MMCKTDFCETIRGILANRSLKHLQNGYHNYAPAAVLIPVFKKNGEYYVLFTKRAPRVKYHRGHVCFPGGVVDKNDSGFKDTALREANEEIGLLKQDVDILGQVDDSLTFSPPFIIHPFVGLIPHPYPFRINSKEVEKIFAVPLNFFVSHEGGAGLDATEYEPGFYFPEYRYSGELIWGTTASITANFVGILQSGGACPYSCF